jgi:nitric oxide reductase large subunit
MLALLFVPRRWAARCLQAGLLLGTVEWARTTAELVAQRQSAHLPWLRMAAILGAVALATAACALVFRSPRVRRHFGYGLPARALAEPAATTLQA